MPPRFIPVFAVVEVAFMIKYKKKLDMYLIIGNVIKKPKKKAAYLNILSSCISSSFLLKTSHWFNWNIWKAYRIIHLVNKKY